MRKEDLFASGLVLTTMLVPSNTTLTAWANQDNLILHFEFMVHLGKGRDDSSLEMWGRTAPLRHQTLQSGCLGQVVKLSFSRQLVLCLRG